MSELDLNPAPAEPTSQPSTPDPAIVSQPAAPPATSMAPAPVPQEDRSTWVPPYRLRETREAVLREAQQAWAEREATIRAEAEQYKRQLQALVGVSPQENPEIAAIRQQFTQLFPGLAKLEEQADNLLGLTDRSTDMEAQSRHYWQSYGRNAMDRLYASAEKSLGAPLSADGKRSLHAAFLGYVSSSPQLTERYTNDPSVVDEFWTSFSGSLIDPVRRSASATVQQQTGQRHLPQDRSAAIPNPLAPPKPADLDERSNMAWVRFQAERK